MREVPIHRNRVPDWKKRIAKKYRANPTRAEELMWSILRLERPNHGIRWRRQHILYGYIADFYCPKGMLVLEIDGEIHNKYEDAKRDAIIESHGFKVIRVTNEDVYSDSTEIVEWLREMISIH